MRFLRWVRARWLNLVPEPRYASTVYALVYYLFVATGLATLLLPPQSIEGVLGRAGMNLVGIFLLAGGLVGMWSGWREWWELERWAIAMMSIGLVTYGWIVFQLHFQSTGSRLTQLGIIAVAACVLILRIGMIWRYPYKPRG